MKNIAFNLLIPVSFSVFVTVYALSNTTASESAADSGCVMYVSSSGSDSADGTEAYPYATVKKAVSELSESGGTVYICDSLSSSACHGAYAHNKLPVTISFP